MHYYKHHLSNLWEKAPQKLDADCLNFNLRDVPEFFRFRNIHHLSNCCRAKYLSLCLKNAEKSRGRISASNRSTLRVTEEKRIMCASDKVILQGAELLFKQKIVFFSPGKPKVMSLISPALPWEKSVVKLSLSLHSATSL